MTPTGLVKRVVLTRFKLGGLDRNGHLWPGHGQWRARVGAAKRVPVKESR